MTDADPHPSLERRGQPVVEPAAERHGRVDGTVGVPAGAGGPRRRDRWRRRHVVEKLAGPVLGPGHGGVHRGGAEAGERSAQQGEPSPCHLGDQFVRVLP